MNSLIKYNEETIWLSQLQISELFDTSSDNVSLHLQECINKVLTKVNYTCTRQKA